MIFTIIANVKWLHFHYTEENHKYIGRQSMFWRVIPIQLKKRIYVKIPRIKWDDKSKHSHKLAGNTTPEVQLIVLPLKIKLKMTN